MEPGEDLEPLPGALGETMPEEPAAAAP